MGYYISSLIKDMDLIDELANWIDSKPFPNLGIELFAHTHDKDYWDRLHNVLKRISCPIAFHGPYINVEAASSKGSAEYDWFITSYKKVFALAKDYGIKNVVFHYTQGLFQPDTIEQAKKASEENISLLIRLAEEYQINMLIENLPFAKGKTPLYNNEEYFNIFDKNKNALSVIDIGHAHMNNLNIEQYLKTHGERVKSYHFHNNNGVLDQHNSIKDGTFNYKKFFPLFKKYTPNADIVLEYGANTKLSYDELLQDLYYIEESIV